MRTINTVIRRVEDTGWSYWIAALGIIFSLYAAFVFGQQDLASRGMSVLIGIACLLILLVGMLLITVPTPRSQTIRLMWDAGPQFLALFYADKKFRELKVKDGGARKQIYPVATVFDGTDEFGICSAMELVAWHHDVGGAEGKERWLVPLCVIFTTSPVCILAKTGAKLESLNDLSGKSVGILGTANSIGEELKVLARQAKVDFNRVVIENELDAVDAFLKRSLQMNSAQKGFVDFTCGYDFNEGIKIIGHDDITKVLLSRLWPEKYYADTLFTTFEFYQRRRSEAISVARHVAEGVAQLSGEQGAKNARELLREFAPHWAKHLESKFYAARKLDPWNEVSLKFRLFGGGVTQASLIGDIEVWRRMEGLVLDESTETVLGRPGSYSAFLNEAGLFKDCVISHG